MNPCPSGKRECFLYFLIRLDPRLRVQVIDACGPKNLWYFREHYPNEEVTFKKLLEYYILNGGAKGFAERESLRAFDPMI